jgi:hypothetical protein
MNTNTMNNLCCSVCYQELTEPVIASDGFTYDLTCIKRVITQGYLSPNTQHPLQPFSLRNVMVCQLLNINLPSREWFDLYEEDEWTSLGSQRHHPLNSVSNNKLRRENNQLRKALNYKHRLMIFSQNCAMHLMQQKAKLTREHRHHRLTIAFSLFIMFLVGIIVGLEVVHIAHTNKFGHPLFHV